MSLKKLLDYWRNPDEINDPWVYLNPKRYKRSHYIADLIAKYVGRSASILEIGPNAGRNLVVLYRDGFTNLSGIEINQEATRLMREFYPELKDVIIFLGPVEKTITKLDEYDLIFTMAVLEHIHPESEWIFAEMAKRCTYLVTVEDETSKTWRHFPRDYGEIFTGLGMEQMFHSNDLSNAGLPGFHARVFRSN